MVLINSSVHIFSVRQACEAVIWLGWLVVGVSHGPGALGV
jgi:hypothetical protein